MSRQEDACWRCGASVRHVHVSGRRTHDAILPPPRAPEQDAPACLVRRRRASRAAIAPEVREARGAKPLPSRAEQRARWWAERLDANRRQKQQAGELAAAIDDGDAAYRRLRERLDDFGTRLAVVRLTLSATPARRAGGHASNDEADPAVLPGGGRRRAPHTGVAGKPTAEPGSLRMAALPVNATVAP